MNIQRTQNQPAFTSKLGSIDYEGIYNLGQDVLTAVEKVVPNLKKIGPDEITTSFYATQKGNLGIYCEDKFVPQGNIIDKLTFSTKAKGDGFVFSKDFEKIGEKLQEAIQSAVEKCTSSTNGRFIAKEREREMQQIAKEIKIAATKSRLADKKIKSDFNFD